MSDYFIAKGAITTGVKVPVHIQTSAECVFPDVALLLEFHPEEESLKVQLYRVGFVTQENYPLMYGSTVPIATYHSQGNENQYTMVLVANLLSKDNGSGHATIGYEILVKEENNQNF